MRRANHCRGGVGVEKSASYVGPEFERVFYKLNYGYRVAIQNLYMVYQFILMCFRIFTDRNRFLEVQTGETLDTLADTPHMTSARLSWKTAR